MKKIALGLVALVSAFAAQAITVTEAFDQAAELPGAAVSEMPDYDVAKEGLDWGKIVMLLGQPKSVVDAIEAEITDPLMIETEVGGQPTRVYASGAVEGKAVVLSITNTPMGAVLMLAQGNAEEVVGSFPGK